MALIANSPLTSQSISHTIEVPSDVVFLEKSQIQTRFLDGLRGLAAIYVLLHHAFSWMHPGFRNGYLRHPEQYGTSKKVLLYLSESFRFGEMAVIFFFVLSGFVIHLGYAKKHAIKEPLTLLKCPSFLFRRARRLYPPLLAAVMLTFIIDRAGTARGYPVYFAETSYAVINQNIGTDHQISTLAGNLAFLMRTYVPVWGTNGPLWSLKYEWWFYAAYPLLWPFLRCSVLGPTVVLGVLYILSNAFPGWPIRLWSDIFSEMPVWWMGALLAEVYIGRIVVSFRQVALLTAILPIALALTSLGRTVPHVVWGLGFSGVIALGFYLQQFGMQLRLLERLKCLGDCSYTLYVIHAPFVVFTSGWLMHRSATGELSSSFIPALCTLSIVPIAYGLHFLVEKPFVRFSARAFPQEDAGECRLTG